MIMRPNRIPCCAQADLTDPCLVDIHACTIRRDHQRGEAHNSGPMLVIVHHRYIEHGLQTFLDFKATGCGNVLQLDRGECHGNGRDRLDNFIGILGI
jgi:hypothetical protein